MVFLFRESRTARRRFAALLLLFFAAALSFPFSVGSSAAISRRNYLRTSYDPEAYTLFEIDGNHITAVGVYKNDRLRRITAPHDAISAMQFSAKADGSFEARFTMVPGNGASVLNLEFDSGVTLSYRVHSDETGRYFPDNGLSEANRAVFEHIYDAPAEAVRLYLSASGDPARAAEVRDRLSQISDSVTEGLDDDYEKARAISSYISSRFYYDQDARNTGVTEETVALENVLKNTRTVCSGFANLTCALLQAQGIDAVAVKGGVSSGGVTYDKLAEGVQNHEFAAFWYEKENRWVWLDACWSGSGNYVNGEYVSELSHGKYFDISDDALALNHRADYAERRNFFDEAVFAGGGIVGTGSPADETEAEGENPAPKEKADADGEENEPQPNETNAVPASTPTQTDREDNTPLLIAVFVLGIGVILLCFYLIGLLKGGRTIRSKAILHKKKGNIIMVVIELQNGKQIKIELYPDIAPITVKNFEELVAGGFYDGLTFHRVIRGFMIQGGCPLGNGTGNSGKHIKGEFAANGVENSLKHTRGVLSMARAADPDSASCQFFIMHEDAPHLDGNYAAFGKVVEGMDAVDEIAQCETDYADMPVTPIVMKSVKIV